MPINEIQELKRRYPKYEDIPDELMLQKLVQKFPKHGGLGKVAEREFGAIKKPPVEKPTGRIEPSKEYERAFRTERFTNRLVKEAYGEEGLKEIETGQKRLRAFMGRAPRIAIAFASPIFSVALETMQQGKNVLISKIKEEKYNPMEMRMLTELLPKETPTPLKVISSLGETLGEIALVGGLMNLATEGTLRATLREMGGKLEKAGYGKGKIPVSNEAIKQAARGTRLETEAARYLKAKMLKIPAAPKVKAPTAAAPRILDTVVAPTKAPVTGKMFRGELIDNVEHDLGNQLVFVNKVGYPVPYLTYKELDAVGLTPKGTIPKTKPVISKIEVTKKLKLPSTPKSREVQAARKILGRGLTKEEMGKIELKHEEKPKFRATLYQGKGAAKEKVYSDVQLPIAGKGTYAAFSEKEASKFGKVSKVEVELDNPMVIRTDDEWGALTRAAGWRYPNLLGLKKPEIAKNTEDIKSLIQSHGHDGLVIKISREGDAGKTLKRVFGTDQVVSYKPEVEVPAKPPEVKVPKITKYSDDSHYQVDYRTPAGIRKTTMSGTYLNEAEGLIQINQIPRDGSGIPILEIVDTVPVKGTAGFANMTVFDDAITNMQGFKEERTAGYSQFAKKFGTPFFMGEKYPSFRPVYSAVRESVDYGQELNYTGLHMLNPKFLRGLPGHSKARIVDALRLGNMEKREIGDAELVKNFGFNDDEVKGFRSIRKMYKYSTDIAIKRRKLSGGYEKLTPEKRAEADDHIEKQVRRFEGYVSQSRLGGNWATYVESPDSTSPNFPFSFSLHPNKAAAVKEAHLLGGTSKNVYLRKNLKPTLYGRMSITDLENLADSAGVDVDSPDLKALIKEVQKGSFSSHWIRRKNIPGYEWNMDNVIDSAMDYNQGASSGLARATGRQSANRAYIKNLDKMTPELKKYSTDYIDGYFETGAIGMPFFQHLLYNWEIALKPSQMAQNLSQPLATTLSSMMEHYPVVEAHKVFLNSYDLAGRYTMYKMDGKRHGLSSELLGYLNKLDRQGKLGEQMIKFMQDSRTFSKAGFDKVTGSSMRVVEFWNRVHAAIIGRRTAVDKGGLTDKDAILTFGKDFIARTQFEYGKHNLPAVITGAGNIKNLLRLMYTFRHYQVSNLQRIMKMSPLRGAKGRQWMSALASALALHGWKGLPFMGLAALAWKKVTGRTMEYDIRKALDDAEVPGKVIDLAEVGLPSVAGADISQLVGMGDVVPTYGSVAENIMGAPAGFTRRMGTATYFAARGDTDRALENASPGTIRNMFKGLRYLREKVRTAKGELIATPSARDIILQSMGFNPLAVSKKWKERETKKAMKAHEAKNASDYYQRIAEAMDNKDYEGMRRLRLEAKEKGIRLGRRGTKDWRRRRRGREVSVPRKLRREFKEVERVFE